MVGAGLALSPPAWGATVVSSPGPEHLSLRGGKTADVASVTYRRQNHTYLVRGHRVAPGDEMCESLGRRKVRCPTGGAVERLTIEGHGGDDTLQVVGPGGWVEMHGDRGDDTLIGNADGNVVWGGVGEDTLIGRGGADHLGNLSGDGGIDRFIAGRGHDRIHAWSDRAQEDRILDCGLGEHDVIEVDRLDPSPSRCERVRLLPD
jgi:Ca2+-binding RTX toxin-like protein